ncbi:hypothetical protein [Thiolapillus brandeum]|uniref:Uncharacterized protein n=1 Tax=Thiolapillus brandeum TaxID=1076588 RepID=A0A7U6GII6_9GAMM|nr:hypothetical protein [Thiolapillus brandeum]BAO44233.1 conserved hypothetical protein [Thiolapillus brandeum]
MNIWLQIGMAVTIVLMLVFMYPATKHWLKNSPKANKGDWPAVFVALALVVGFVLLLILLVKS